jgi:ABC-2 type transport system ATP-binding protein
MGAARYIGRIGGLAVALGVGAAAFIGCGVAVAAPASSSSSTSSAGSSGTGTKPDASSGAGSSTASGSSTTSTPTGPKASTSSSVGVGTRNAKHRSSASHDADTIGGQDSTRTAAPQSGTETAAASSAAQTSPHKTRRSRPSSSASANSQPDSKVAAIGSAANDASSGSTGVADEVSAKTRSTDASSSNPSDVTSPAVTTLSKASASVSTPVALNALVAIKPTTLTAPPPPNVLTVLASVVEEILNSAKRNAPAAPLDPPRSWVETAAARREISDAAVNLAPTGPITVNPTLTFSDGIIEGSANATDAHGLPLAYTIVSGPSQGGKITFIPEAAAGTFGYLPNAAVLSSGTESFSELVSETTPFDTALEGLPIVGAIAQSILTQLYRNPLLDGVLAPLIGSAVVVPFTANPSALDPTDAPIAFTTAVTSFDGTPISTNFFPAPGLQTGQSAPTILEGPGLGDAGLTDPESQTGIASVPGLVPGIAPLRGAGYNVVTWDPRGEYASGGTLQLDSPAFEGKDVSSIITYVLSLPETTDNQRIGMVGGSYGGGIQLVSAAIDPRIDAIVPGIAWNTLTSSLYPNQAFKTSWGALLTLDLLEAGARINPQIYSGILTGALLGILTPSQQALLARSGPGALVSDITVPTLLIQGTVDGLFPLSQAVTNEQLLAANNVPVKMIWFCGGHGICLDPGDPTAQATLLTNDTLAWLNQYVMQDGTPANAIPTFQWVDQDGIFHSSNVFPSNPNFQGTPVTASSAGGTLPIVPIIGGAGPQTKVLQAPLSPFDAALLSTATAAPASIALNLDVSVPGGTQIVGAPQLTFTYSGLGTTRTVYAQIVDDQSGLVLGNIDSPIPVTLDGRTHTVSLALGTLQDVAYTAPSGGGTLTLQLVGSATQFENLTSYGVITVSDMTISLPTVGAGAGESEEMIRA